VVRRSSGLRRPVALVFLVRRAEVTTRRERGGGGTSRGNGDASRGGGNDVMRVGAVA
jgi:hypothetical protein